MDRNKQDIQTKLVHSGEPDSPIEGAVALPIFQSATFAYRGQDSYHDLKYIRLNNTPNHQVLHSVPPFTAKDLPFELLGTMRMTLTTARWSLSPQRGRENWPAVTARVFNLRQCCTSVDTPSPPPSPPSRGWQ